MRSSARSRLGASLVVSAVLGLALSAAAAAQEDNDEYDTGYRNGYEDRRSTWEPGFSLIGTDFAPDGAGAGAGHQTPDAETCRDLCLRHAQCGGWKFTGQQYPHPDQRNVCFLFSRSPSRHPSGIAGVISGVIEEPR